GGRRAPLCNPRGPAVKSVLRTAFASELQPAARRNSTSCLGSPQSAIPGGLTLSSFLRLTNFKRGLIGFSGIRVCF
ncbi:hypothetical protein LZ634_15480, partial [Kluyvera intermedia]|uniref:hypothetical protein n=1 Tax=Kluyvera intermedia TaxID=61648 RepID=UPI001F4276EF